MQTIPNYDATFCGRLPLHQINSIQPHGVVILIDHLVQQVLQVSENVQQLLSATPATVAGAKLSDILEAESLVVLQALLQQGLSDKAPVELSFKTPISQRPSLCLVHALEEGYIIEAALNQYFTNETQTFISVYQRVRQVMQHIGQSNTLQEVCDATATHLKQITGFDKVMVYCFDEGWNGFVISEAAEAEMESYLGLMFPASDIPRPAREMYRDNAYRVIPNVDYEPVKLYPLLNPGSGGFTNLIKTDLRSVAAVHLEYLRNMKVMASMSARLLHEGQLWGLVACHHRTAKYMSFEECAVVEMIANVAAQKISAVLLAEKANLRQQLARQFAHIAERLLENRNVLEAFGHNSSTILRFLNADGLAITWDGIIEKEGETPEDSDIDTLLFWLREKVKQQTYHEHRLPAVFEESKAFAATASGILALPIQPERGNYLIAFRRELVHTVSWSGNPHEALQFEKNSVMYHPRHSFEVWQQTVHYSAKKWHEEEVAAAEQLRNFMIQQTLNTLN